MFPFLGFLNDKICSSPPPPKKKHTHTQIYYIHAFLEGILEIHT
jgi:hypothetical protein